MYYIKTFHGVSAVSAVHYLIFAYSPIPDRWEESNPILMKLCNL